MKFAYLTALLATFALSRGSLFGFKNEVFFKRCFFSRCRLRRIGLFFYLVLFLQIFDAFWAEAFLPLFLILLEAFGRPLFALELFSADRRVRFRIQKGPLGA